MKTQTFGTNACLEGLIRKWREHSDDNAAYGELLRAGKAVAYAECADELEAALEALAAPPAEAPANELARELVAEMRADAEREVTVGWATRLARYAGRVSDLFAGITTAEAPAERCYLVEREHAQDETKPLIELERGPTIGGKTLFTRKSIPAAAAPAVDSGHWSADDMLEATRALRGETTAPRVTGGREEMTRKEAWKLAWDEVKKTPLSQVGDLWQATEKRCNEILASFAEGEE